MCADLTTTVNLAESRHGQTEGTTHKRSVYGTFIRPTRSARLDLGQTFKN